MLLWTTILEIRAETSSITIKEENRQNFGLDFVTMEDQSDVLKTGEAVFHHEGSVQNLMYKSHQNILKYYFVSSFVYFYTSGSHQALDMHL